MTHAPSIRLQSRFAFRDPMLFMARATLLENHLELSGWQFGGRYRRLIGLDRIVHVDQTGNRNLTLWLVDGEAVRLRIDKADRWHRELSANNRTQ